jgi:hypothetical protein
MAAAAAAIVSVVVAAIDVGATAAAEGSDESRRAR